MRILMSLFLFTLSFNLFAAQREVLSLEGKKELTVVMSEYEKFHKSFYDYNAKEVEKNAKSLSLVIGKIKDQKINAVLGKLPNLLSKITATSPREQNDSLFDGASSAMIMVVEKFDLGNMYNAYSCPMVKKRWVQNTTKSSKVLNPYDPDMKNCGTKDTNY